MAEDLLDRDPNQPEVAAERARFLFNAAVVEMRDLQPDRAPRVPERLDPPATRDEEAARVLRFTEKYKTRPVDLQLNTFIKSLSLR